MQPLLQSFFLETTIQIKNVVQMFNIHILILLVPPNLRISWSHGLDVADTPSHGQHMSKSNITSVHDPLLTYQNPSFQGASSNLHYPSYYQKASDSQQTPCGGGNTPTLQEALSQQTDPLLRAIYIDDSDKVPSLLMILESVNDASHIMITRNVEYYSSTISDSAHRQYTPPPRTTPRGARRKFTPSS